MLATEPSAPSATYTSWTVPPRPISLPRLRVKPSSARWATRSAPVDLLGRRAEDDHARAAVEAAQQGSEEVAERDQLVRRGRARWRRRPGPCTSRPRRSSLDRRRCRGCRGCRPATRPAGRGRRRRPCRRRAGRPRRTARAWWAAGRPRFLVICLPIADDGEALVEVAHGDVCNSLCNSVSTFRDRGPHSLLCCAGAATRMDPWTTDSTRRVAVARRQPDPVRPLQHRLRRRLQPGHAHRRDRRAGRRASGSRASALGEVVAGAVLKHARDFNLTRESVLGSQALARDARDRHPAGLRHRPAGGDPGRQQDRARPDRRRHRRRHRHHLRRAGRDQRQAAQEADEGQRRPRHRRQGRRRSARSGPATSGSRSRRTASRAPASRWASTPR